jgi:phosphatidylglycerol phospholipase C
LTLALKKGEDGRGGIVNGNQCCTIRSASFLSSSLPSPFILSFFFLILLVQDASLKRCFGVDKSIHDSTWEYLSSLRTLRAPHEGMPRLIDLLRWLRDEPGLEKTWLLLDIKLDDRVEQLLTAVRETLDAVPLPLPSSSSSSSSSNNAESSSSSSPPPLSVATAWEQRVVLGCWNATFVDAARRILPAYPVALITWSLAYARHFLPVPGLGFNMHQKSLVGFLGAWFLRVARREDRPVFAWTVNGEREMEWCIERNNKSSSNSSSKVKSDDDKKHGRSDKLAVIDGVITDDPKLFLQVCERWQNEHDGTKPPRKQSLASRIRHGVSLVREGVLFQVAAVLGHIRMRYVVRKWDLFKDRDEHVKSKQE